jgi:hypothetical protein
LRRAIPMGTAVDSASLLFVLKQFLMQFVFRFGLSRFHSAFYTCVFLKCIRTILMKFVNYTCLVASFVTPGLAGAIEFAFPNFVLGHVRMPVASSVTPGLAGAIGFALPNCVFKHASMPVASSLALGLAEAIGFAARLRSYL